MIERIEVKSGKEGYLFDKYNFIISALRTPSGKVKLQSLIDGDLKLFKAGDWLVCEDRQLSLWG